MNKTLSPLRRGRSQNLEAFAKLQGFKWETCAKDRLLWDSWESKYVAWKDGADGVATT